MSLKCENMKIVWFNLHAFEISTEGVNNMVIQ